MGLTNKIIPAGSRRREILRQGARGAFEGVRRLEWWATGDNHSSPGQAVPSRRASASSPQAKPAAAAAATSAQDGAEPTPRSERRKLKRSWAKHRPEDLAEYLVNGYQNPRINGQSILARHFLMRQLFGSEFDGLMHEELKFCVETNTAIRDRAEELGVRVGVRLDPARRAEIREVCKVVADREDEFEKRWAEALKGRRGGPLKVLEFACGSANDYRFLDRYGIAKSLDYTGVDLNEDNIANAKQMFPATHFEEQSILDLPFPDDSFDYVLAFDIFEHLSLEAMEQAMREAMRVSRQGIVIAFFIMVDKPEHNERPKRNYYWNELSADRIKQLLQEKYPSVSFTHLGKFLRREYGARGYYNPKAWTVIAECSSYDD